MTDPGHPFSRRFGDVVAAMEERVRRGVEQPRSVSFVVDPQVDSYELPRETHAVTRVTGLKDATFTVFERETHFAVSANRLRWVDDETPDEGSRLDVEYTYRSPPAGLTDFNPGSVIGTLVGAVARELTVVHEQMDQAYRRAFVDHASGVALDNVVALLGVERIPATKATGEVTFSRRRPEDEPLEIPEHTRVADEADRLFVTTEPAEIAAGKESVDVRVEAVEAGPDGNVNAETLVVMPTPPAGIDRVTNPTPTTAGHDSEPDDQLRERAKHALERSGNATLNAIRFAVLGVEGVQGTTVLDHSTDPGVPLGEVRVRHAGGDPAEIERVVERTRAAGVLARVEEIVEVTISGSFVLIGEREVPSNAEEDFLDEVVEELRSLSIGESLSLRRLNALAFATSGLADVAEAQLVSRTDPEEEGVPLPDPFLTADTQQVRPAEGELDTVLLASLHVADTVATDQGYEVSLQLLDTDGTAVAFRDLRLSVLGAFTATPRSAPEQREPIGDLDADVAFVDSDTATLEIAEVEGHDPDEHEAEVELELSAPPYPGLRPATTILDLGEQPNEPQ